MGDDGYLDWKRVCLSPCLPTVLILPKKRSLKLLINKNKITSFWGIKEQVSQFISHLKG